jgi:hypothetical protein
VDDGLVAGQHARAHLYAFGAKHQRRGRRSRIAHSACGEQWQVDVLCDEWQQHHRGRGERRLESAAFHTFHHQGVHAGVDRLHCALQ